MYKNWPLLYTVIGCTVTYACYAHYFMLACTYCNVAQFLIVTFITEIFAVLYISSIYFVFFFLRIQKLNRQTVWCRYRTLINNVGIDIQMV